MINVEEILSLSRLIIGLIILGYASYTDIKTRKASNKLWIIMIIFGCFFIIIQYYIIGYDNLFYLLFIPIMIGFMFVLFQLRIIFGGADAKAIMAISVLTPLEPSIMSLPIINSILPFSWVIFSNSLILFLLLPLGLFIYNLLKKNIRFPYCFLGYILSIKTAKKKFVWPLEKIINGKRKFSYIPKDLNAKDEWDKFLDYGINEIWVTPKIPFMIPLMAGFISSFILGDILLFLTNIFI